MTDHYKTLGIDKNATADEIKRAYRKMANQHHPDKGGNAADFQNVQAAYDTLSDAGKRQLYDSGGQNPWSGWHTNHGNGPQNIHDIFGQFFNSQHHHNPFEFFSHQQRQPRNLSINIAASVTLEEAFNGKDFLAEVTLPSGRTQTINIKIPAGIADGTTLRISGLGDDSHPGIPRGDIHLNVNVQPHHTFTRQGDDLVKILEISCIDAMLGSTTSITTIDGKTLEVTINAGIQHDQILSAPGYGMPNMNDSRFRGRLLMPIKIVIPSTLTQGQQDLLKKFNQV